MPGGILPQTDGVELRQDEVNQLVAEAAENFAYADGAADMTGSIGEGGAQLLQAAYHPDDATGLGTAPHMTVIQKSADDAAADDEDEFDDEMFAGAESKTMIVGRGDTLQSLFTKAGTEPSEADDIIEALSPIFGAKDLKPGQELRFTLVPAPSDTGQMEPVKVSVFLKGDHLATVARNRQGEYVASAQAIGNDVKTPQGQARATLYTSFYHAAIEQHVPAETILKLLRVHSYDVDFKQKVKAGDTVEMFFDGGSDDEVGELLYTSMTIDGKQRKFYRFRTPDDVVDYYDEQGNSAKKFLMRNPVRGGRFTSGFGERRHPLLEDHAHAYRRRLGRARRHADPRRRRRHRRADRRQRRLRQLCAHPPRQRLHHRLRPHVALCRRRRAGRRREAGPGHRLCRLDRHVHRPALPLRGAGQQQLRQPDDRAGTARPATRRPPARRVPKRAQPHRSADADGSGDEPRRASQLTDFVRSFLSSFLSPPAEVSAPCPLFARDVPARLVAVVMPGLESAAKILNEQAR